MIILDGKPTIVGGDGMRVGAYKNVLAFNSVTHAWEPMIAGIEMKTARAYHGLAAVPQTLFSKC